MNKRLSFLMFAFLTTMCTMYVDVWAPYHIQLGVWLGGTALLGLATFMPRYTNKENTMPLFTVDPHVEAMLNSPDSHYYQYKWTGRDTALHQHWMTDEELDFLENLATAESLLMDDQLMDIYGTISPATHYMNTLMTNKKEI